MTAETLQKLDLFRRLLDKRRKEEKAEFKRIAATCGHRKDNSGRHGMYAQIDACKASGIRTLKACDITTCPAIH
jgi:hypothetical protein